VHHILSLYGTGANAAQLQRGYDFNATYQRTPTTGHPEVVRELQESWSNAKKYQFNEKYVPDFLAFFQAEIEKKGWQQVLSEYVFADTDAGTDMQLRLFAGFLHPIIRLMYGVEWAQPAIVAEALAEACSHPDNLREYLVPAEEEAAKQHSSSPKQERIIDLYRAVAADEKLAHAAHWDDPNKIHNGVLARAKDEMMAIATRVRVGEDEVDERTAEMCDAAFLMAASAAVYPGKHIKFDFYLM
jgi:hypothetical protein